MRPEDRLDSMLDQALEMTFPASDPISVYMPEARIDMHDKVFDEDEFPAAA